MQAEFKVGGWSVRPSANEVSKRGVSRRLRPQLMDLLVLFAERAGQVVSKEEIRARIWQTAFVTSTALPRCITELRRSLAESSPAGDVIIETIPKRGYRLVAPVTDEPGGRTRQPSVLVLPFRDLSKATDQQYFCDGLAEQIISSLTRIAGLRVIARNSAFLRPREASDPDQIARRLHADKILLGSLRRTGDRIRITVTLADVATHGCLWSNCYERSNGDILDLQDEITLAIVEGLKVELPLGERDRVFKRHTSHVGAHTWYLKGLYHWNRRSHEGVALARECLERAIRDDPQYPLPYVTLANSYTVAGFYGLLAPAVAFPEATRLAQRGLAIDPNLPQAHAALGFIQCVYDGDWTASEAHFRKALALGPNDSATYVWYALGLSWAGKSAAAADVLERGSWSDPLSPVVLTTRGVLLYEQERYQEACQQFRQVIELDPEFPLAHLHLARALSAIGEYDEAVTHAMKGAALSKSGGRAFLALAYGKAGQSDLARVALAELLAMSKVEYVSPVMIAYAHAALGDSARVARCLAHANEIRDPLRIQAGRDPMLRQFWGADETLLLPAERGLTARRRAMHRK